MAKKKKAKECFIGEKVREGKTPGEAFAELAKMHEEHMKKFGWYAHYVLGGTDIPANYHTHGISETFPGQLDFQIALPLNQSTAHNMFSTLVERLRKGEKFVAGEKYSEVVANYSVLLRKAKEGNRVVLRIIVPDADGEFEPEKMKGGLKIQYRGIMTGGEHEG